LQQEIATGTTPTYTVGIPSAPRIYSLVQAPPAGTVCPSGAATGIDAATNTITSVLCTGANPVYGVMSADARRAFVLNKASGTVTVINAQTNQLDTFLNSSNQVSNTIPVGTNPVWADFAPTLNELFVLNAGNGTTPGTVNIISIPLCSQTAQVNNPNCDSSNPEDAVGFGTILATIPVGINPTVIGVLQDGTQAYVANAGNTATGVQGSVSVINLQTDTVVATIAASNASTVSLSDTLVHGNPGFLAVTTGTPTGKVYVTSPNSKDLTIIRTDIDQVSSHVTLQGLGVMVRVTQP
jgi:DNA-binding beta-propeller fold protein YncE